MPNSERTTCLVVGDGPAGMVLGLLMARAGIRVTVLEKHADLLRDFRGDMRRLPAAPWMSNAVPRRTETALRVEVREGRQPPRSGDGSGLGDESGLSQPMRVYFNV